MKTTRAVIYVLSLAGISAGGQTPNEPAAPPPAVVSGEEPEPPCDMVAIAQKNLPPEKRDTDRMLAAATAWGRKDFAVAIKWASDEPDIALQNCLQAAVAVGYADRNPPDAMAFALSILRPGEITNRAVGDIMATWTVQNAKAAAQWASQLPCGEIRSLALTVLLNVWASGYRKPAAAKAWVLAQQTGSERDWLVGHLAQVRRFDNPIEALELVIEHISPGTARTEALSAVLREWAPNCPEAAQAWVENLADPELRAWANACLKSTNQQQ